MLLQRVTSQKKVVACPLRKAMVQDKQQLTKFEMITSILFVLCYELGQFDEILMSQTWLYLQ